VLVLGSELESVLESVLESELESVLGSVQELELEQVQEQVLVLVLELEQVLAYTQLERRGLLAIAPRYRSAVSSWENGNSAPLSAHFEQGHAGKALKTNGFPLTLTRLISWPVP
jgi:hypothetical protein